jgi:hypothetical protein
MGVEGICKSILIIRDAGWGAAVGQSISGRGRCLEDCICNPNSHPHLNRNPNPTAALQHVLSCRTGTQARFHTTRLVFPVPPPSCTAPPAHLSHLFQSLARGFCVLCWYSPPLPPPHIHARTPIPPTHLQACPSTHTLPAHMAGSAAVMASWSAEFDLNMVDATAGGDRTPGGGQDAEGDNDA